MRLQIVGRRLDNCGIARQHVDQLAVFRCRERGHVDRIDVGVAVGLVENPTAAGVDVLDVGSGLGLEIQRAVPLEGDPFRGLFGDDVVAHRTDPDLMGDTFDILVVEVVVTNTVAEAVLDLLAGAVDSLVQQVVQHDAGALAGAHLALREIDVRVDHAVQSVGVVTENIEGGL